MNQELKLNNNTIHSLKELRENFDAEAVLEAHTNGTLQKWLEQHYYEREASLMQKVSISQPDCLKKICKILGVDYMTAKKMTPEEQAVWDARKKEIAELTGDAEILANVSLVAMNQEELAKLLHDGEKKIYLCKDVFSVPIRVANVEYIGFGGASIENAYTKKQYERAGITISGISLPDDENPDTERFALKAAKENGYDDFCEYHTPLATAFHRILESRKIMNIFQLPFDCSIISKFFNSKRECENAREKCIRKAYDEAEKYFRPGNSKCIAKEAAEFYSGWITDSFSAPLLETLRTLSTINHADDAYAQLKQLIDKSRSSLLAAFEEELNDTSGYYKMYDFKYFVEQADIDEHDYRISEGGIMRLIENAFSDSVQYTISCIDSSISELQQDVNDNADTFYNAAFDEYKRYVSEIEDKLDKIGANLPDMEEKESVEKYLSRMCIAKAV
jgi:hypothetical protein